MTHNFSPEGGTSPAGPSIAQPRQRTVSHGMLAMGDPYAYDLLSSTDQVPLSMRASDQDLTDEDLKDLGVIAIVVLVVMALLTGGTALVARHFWSRR